MVQDVLAHNTVESLIGKRLIFADAFDKGRPGAALNRREFLAVEAGERIQTHLPPDRIKECHAMGSRPDFQDPGLRREFLEFCHFSKERYGEFQPSPGKRPDIAADETGFFDELIFLLALLGLNPTRRSFPKTSSRSHSTNPRKEYAASTPVPSSVKAKHSFLDFGKWKNHFI